MNQKVNKKIVNKIAVGQNCTIPDMVYFIYNLHSRFPILFKLVPCIRAYLFINNAPIKFNLLSFSIVCFLLLQDFSILMLLVPLKCLTYPAFLIGFAPGLLLIPTRSAYLVLTNFALFGKMPMGGVIS